MGKIVGLLLVLIIIKGIYGNIEVCPRVYAVEGIIKLDLNSSCVISSDKVVYNGTGKEIPGYWYGLIDYKCGNCTGQILSEFNCIDCGIYCPRNDMNVKCRSFWFPSICGMIIGTISFMVCLIVFQGILKKMIPISKEKISSFKQNNNKKRMERFRNKLERVNNIEMSVLESSAPKEIESTMEKTNEGEAGENSVLLNEEQEAPGDFEIVDALITIQAFSENKELKQLVHFENLKKVKTSLKEDVNLVKRLNTLKNDQGNTTTVVAAAIGTLLLLAGPIKACQNILFMSSNNEICDFKECRPISTYVFQLSTNEQICFRMTNNELLKIQLQETSEEVEYYPVYRTSSFEVQTSYVWQCKRLNSNCWYKGECTVGSRHGAFKNTSHIENFDCVVDTLGCENYCVHQTSCTWIHWWLQPSTKQHTVFKRTRSYWRVNLSITFMNLTKEIRLDANKVDSVVNSADFYNLNDLPITIASYMSENFIVEDHLIKFYDKFYKIKAAEKDFPVIGEIGEYQISLDNKTRTYPEFVMNCKAISCKGTCGAPKQSIARLETSELADKVVLNRILEYPDTKIIVEHFKRANIGLMIGNLEITNLHIAPAKCEIDLIAKYGCTGCNSLPYIVLKSESIIENGILKFLTNCSFVEKVISCTTKLQKLRLENRYENCYIHFPHINKTINFKMTYEFLGGLTRYNTEFSTQNQQLVDTALGVLYNSNFLDSIKITFLLGTLITSVCTITAKLFRCFYLSKKVDEKDKP